MCFEWNTSSTSEDPRLPAPFPPQASHGAVYNNYIHMDRIIICKARATIKQQTAWWHDYQSWGQQDPFPTWRTFKPFKLLCYWTAKIPHVAWYKQPEIKLDPAQSDPISFTGQDFQGASPRVREDEYPQGQFWLLCNLLLRTEALMSAHFIIISVLELTLHYSNKHAFVACSGFVCLVTSTGGTKHAEELQCDGSRCKSGSNILLHIYMYI